MSNQSSISNYQKRKCLNILNKIVNYHISCMFLLPVDPEGDQCPDYFDIIKHPMDLKTIRENLENDKYTTVNQFKDDVNLVWENALRYNKKNSPVYFYAKHLQIVFKEMSEFLSDNEICDWAMELESLKSKVNLIAKNCPTASAPSSIGLSPQSSTRISSRQSDQLSTELPYNAKKSKKSHSSHFQQQDKQAASHQKISKKSPKKDNKETVISHNILDIDNQANLSIKSSHSLANFPISKGEYEKESSSSNKKVPPLPEEELQKLIDDIQSITDVTILHKIISMIRSKNPSISSIENDFDEIEIRVSDIKNSTLIEVKKYVESLYIDENDVDDGTLSDHSNEGQL